MVAVDPPPGIQLSPPILEPTKVPGHEGQPIVATPLSYWCCNCDSRVGAVLKPLNAATLISHFKSKNCYTTNNSSTLASVLSTKRSSIFAACSARRELWYRYLANANGKLIKINRYLCSCGFTASDTTHLKRHVDKANTFSCNVITGTTPCFKSVCDNYIPLSYVYATEAEPVTEVYEHAVAESRPVFPKECSIEIAIDPNKMDYALSDLFTPPSNRLKLIESALSPYTEEEDDFLSYVATFDHLINDRPTSAADFTKTMKNIVHPTLSFDNSPPDDQPYLKALISAGNLWLEKHARHHSMLADPTTRTYLNRIGATGGSYADEGDRVKHDDAFVMRKGVESLKSILQKYLCFAVLTDVVTTTYTIKLVTNVHASVGGDESSVAERIQYLGVVPNLLCSLFSKDVTAFQDGSPLLTFLAASSFTSAANGGIRMLSPHKIATTAAAFLQVLKLARLTRYFIVGRDNQSIDLRDYSKADAQKFTESILFSQICGHISRARTLDSKRVRLPPSRVESDGTVHVTEGGLVFPSVCYFRLIDSLMAKSVCVFGKLFMGDIWMKVIDRENHVWVEDASKCTKFELHLPNNHTIYSTSIVVNTDRADLKSLVYEIFSVVLFSIMTLGGGAIRNTESLFLIDRSMIGWLSNRLYFYALPMKQHCVFRKKHKDLVQHVLPRSISRAVLLFFSCVLPVMKEDYSIQSGLSDKAVAALVRELFDFGASVPVNYRQIRQFVAAVANWAFPTDESVTVANPIVAAKFNHKHNTHSSRYHSEVMGGEDNFYENYHCLFGEDGEMKKYAEMPPLAEYDTSMAMRYVYGHTASWRSLDIKEGYEHCLNNYDTDSFLLSGTGTGKSSVFFLPTVMYHVMGIDPKCTIIISPYRNVTIQHREKMIKLLSPRFSNVTILSLTLGDVGTWPEILDSDKDRPNLLVVSIDAMAKLLDENYNQMKRLDDDNKLRYIITDEVHCYISDTYREAFGCLQALSCFKTPKMFLDATLPKQMIPSIAESLGLGTTYKVLGGKHYRYPNVTVKVIERDREKFKTLEEDLFNLLDDLFRTGSAAIFVICMTVQNSIDFKLAADDRYPGKKAMSYNRETSEADKETISRDLDDDDLKIDLLFSTYDCAVDGKHVNTVVFAGNVRGKVSFYQGVGRIRPPMQGPDARVLVLFEGMRDSWRNQILKEEEESAKKLVLQNRLPSEDMYHDSFGTRGMETMLTSKECRIVSLMNTVGFRLNKVCGKCDVCTDTSPRLEQIDAQRKRREKLEQRKRDAIALLDLCKEKCPKCMDKNCFGGCWSNIKCRRCSYSSHFTKNCVLSEKNKFKELFGVSAGVCYSCYCKDKFSNCGRECRIKDRIKYLLARNVKVKEGKPNNRGEQFEEALKRDHKSEENWLLTMSLMKRKVWKVHKLDQSG